MKVRPTANFDTNPTHHDPDVKPPLLAILCQHAVNTAAALFPRLDRRRRKGSPWLLSAKAVAVADEPSRPCMTQCGHQSALRNRISTQSRIGGIRSTENLLR